MSPIEKSSFNQKEILYRLQVSAQINIIPAAVVKSFPLLSGAPLVTTLDIYLVLQHRSSGHGGEWSNWYFKTSWDVSQKIHRTSWSSP